MVGASHVRRLGIRISSLIIFLLAASSAWAAEGEAATVPRPNIIFVLTDDMRWDAMGCAGNTIIQTPSLDRLASEGVRFRNAFCTTSICATSRASILTGQYARRHGINDFSTHLSQEQLAHAFPLLLRKAGYYTGFVGKWGLGGPLPEDGFDFWSGFSGQGSYFEEGDPEHLTAKLEKQVIRFLEGRTAERPFLLCLSTKAPHVQDRAPRPFQPDPRYDDLYADARIPLPALATEEAFKALPEFTQKSEGRIRWASRFNTPEKFQSSVKDYYRLITGVDRVVGEIMDLLDKKKMADNTVIIFTSDNGFFLGERGLAGKWLMYEESIRLPLIIRHPKIERGDDGKFIDEMALSIDIAPTILDFAGVEASKVMQGRSLRPLMAGDAKGWRDAFFYEHLYGHRGLIPRTDGIRTNNWKYTRYLDTDPVYEELFDLQRDPLERYNIVRSPQYLDVLESLRKRFHELAEAAQ